MGQFCKAIDNVQTVTQTALDCRPGLGGLNQVYGPNCPTPSVKSICGKNINIFTRFNIQNFHSTI